MLAGDGLHKFTKDYSFETVLDIGCGRGDHTKYLLQRDKTVTALDISISDQFRKDEIIKYHKENLLLKIVEKNFDTAKDLGTFDAVWASHVLEHQLNVNSFLKKIKSVLTPGGVVCITVPPMKHQIVGGHVSMWNAGILLYNLVLAGFDCSTAKVKKYGYNISVLAENNDVPESVFKQLKFDSGDINTISPYLPPTLRREGFNGDIGNVGWKS